MASRTRPTKSVPADDAARLPDAELDVLTCLWRQGPSTAGRIRDALHESRPMAHGSAVTLLKRLEAKGLVTREKAPTGKAYVYSPTRKPGPTYRKLVRNLLDRVFSGDAVHMMASLFESQPPTAKQLKQLRKLLDDQSPKRTSKGDLP